MSYQVLFGNFMLIVQFLTLLSRKLGSKYVVNVSVGSLFIPKKLWVTWSSEFKPEERPDVLEFSVDLRPDLTAIVRLMYNFVLLTAGKCPSAGRQLQLS